MSRSLLHDWESSIESNSAEFLKIAEDIYNTAYARGKASEERPHGEWIKEVFDCVSYKCSVCNNGYHMTMFANFNFCPNCGAKMT